MSNRLRVSIADLLALTCITALMIWSGFPTSLLAASRFAFSVAIIATYTYVRMLPRRSFRGPIMASLAYFAFSLVCWWSLVWVGYFLYENSPNSRPYFEDGVITEGVVLPFLYFLFYSPLVSIVAFLATATAKCVLRFVTTNPGEG